MCRTASSSRALPNLPDSTAAAWKLIAGPDTVSVKALSRKDFLTAHRVDWGDEQAAAASAQRRPVRQAAPDEAAPAPAARPPRTVSINPNKPLLLPFSSPVGSVDTGKWLLSTDSIAVRDFSAAPDSANPRALRLAAEWTGGKSYRLELLPGAVTDFYGAANADTLRRNFTAPTEKQLGALNLTLLSLKPGQPYILRLLNGNEPEEERFFTADSTSIRFAFSKLQPVAYTAQVIGDHNGNHRWDPGDYFAHRQPEPVYTRKLDPLRANWEVESTLDIDPNQSPRRKGKE